jgi:hypothetical protein
VTAVPPSAEFRSTILAPGFDLENTIEAMLRALRTHRR